MAKHGFLNYLPEILGGAALLATGAGAAGIGPLSGAFGAGAAGTDAAAGAATDVATAGSAIPAATDAGLAATLNAAPATVGGVASDVATPLAAGAPALASDISSPISTAAGDLASALPTANTLLGAASPITSGGGAPNIMASMTDVGYAPGAAPGGAINAASAGAGGGYDPSLTPPGGGAGGDTVNQDFSGGAPSGGSDTSGVNGFLQSLKNNPLQLAGLAPLALAFMQSNSAVPGSQPVTQAAQTATQTAGGLTGQSTQNLSYTNTGALPAGVNESINNAANAAKTRVRSSFAGMGIPPGSSMEAEQLAAVDANAGAERVAAADKLASLGVQEAQAATGQQSIASNLDLALMKEQVQQEKDLEDALAGFSKSLAGPVSSTAGTNTTPAAA